MRIVILYGRRWTQDGYILCTADKRKKLQELRGSIFKQLYDTMYKE